VNLPDQNKDKCLVSDIVDLYQAGRPVSIHIQIQTARARSPDLEERARGKDNKRRNNQPSL
jgi:hypothetical protein